MAISSEIADGLTELDADFPASFVWNSTSYTCLAGSESRQVGAGEFGLEPTDELTLIVQLDQFGTGSKPAERHLVTFNSRSYRIETIEKAPQDAFVIYHLERNR